MSQYHGGKRPIALFRKYAAAGSAYVTAVGVNAVSSFLTIGLATAMLGAGGFGSMMLALGILTLTTILLGAIVERPAFLDISTLDRTEPGAEARIRSVAGAATVGAVVIGAAVSAAAWAFADRIEAAFRVDDLAPWLRALAPVPVALAVWTTQASCLRAQQRVAPAELYGPALQAASRFVLLVIAYALTAPTSYKGGVAAAVITSTLLPCLPMTLLLVPRFAGAHRVFGLADFAYGLRTALIRLFSRENHLGIWMVGYVGSAEQVALFAVAKQFYETLKIAKFAIDSLLAARIGELLGVPGSASALEREMRLARALAFLGCLAGVAPLAVGGPWLFGLFGPYYAAVPIFLLLAAAAMIETSTGSTGHLLILSGQDRPLLYVSVLSMGIFLIGSLAAGSEFAAFGVSVALVAGTLFRNAIEAALAARRLGVVVMRGAAVAVAAGAAAGVLGAAGLVYGGVAWAGWIAFVAALAAVAPTLAEFAGLWRPGPPAPHTP